MSGCHPAVSPRRRDPVAAAGAARTSRGAHGMKPKSGTDHVFLFPSMIRGKRGLSLIFALIAVALLIGAPFGLKPYGIYLLSTWAVMSIAAIGLNLTLGYAGQISLAQAAFVGIGAYVTAYLTTRGWPFWSTYLIGAVACFAIGWLLGYPALRVQHHYLAFVTLAFTTLVYLVFRNEEWLTGGIYGISNIPRPEVFGWSTEPGRIFYYFC